MFMAHAQEELGHADAALYHAVITVYIATQRPRRVNWDEVEALEALPLAERWQRAPRVLWPANPCGFALGTLAALRREIRRSRRARYEAIASSTRPASRRPQAVDPPLALRGEQRGQQALERLHVDRLDHVRVEAGDAGRLAVARAAVAGQRDELERGGSSANCLSRPPTSKPSITGSPRSRIATSGRKCAPASSALGPSNAVASSWPRRSSASASISATSSLSSTTRMRRRTSPAPARALGGGVSTRRPGARVVLRQPDRELAALPRAAALRAAPRRRAR